MTGEEASKGEGTTRAKALMTMSKLLTRLRCLITTIAALWYVQVFAKKRAAGAPNLQSIALQPVPCPESRTGP